MGRINTIMKLAAEAECDLRTARKAIINGAKAVRGRTGERIARVAEKLGIPLGVGDGHGTR
jgi:hypothetical protein